MAATIDAVQAIPVRFTPRHERRQATRPIRKLSIIIPCYNEAGTICQLLDKVTDSKLMEEIEKEILVINDNSKDNTEHLVMAYIEESPNAGIRLFCHEHNKGKGSAIHTGLQAATGDYILIQDADLEYDPSEYNTLLEPIIKNHADVVYGSRFMGGHPHRILFFWHTTGNRILTLISNLLSNLNLTDMNTCYKMFRSDIIKGLPLKETRFGFDPEVTMKIARIPGLKIYEVGISYYGRTFKEGKKIRLRDAVRSVYCMVKHTLFTSHKKSTAYVSASHQL